MELDELGKVVAGDRAHGGELLGIGTWRRGERLGRVVLEAEGQADGRRRSRFVAMLFGNED